MSKSVTSTDIRTLTISKPKKGDCLEKAFLILKHSHETAEALLHACNLLRDQRNASRGALTDEEQDPLRAMIVMTASGLDSLLKQIIRDTLNSLCEVDADVSEELSKYVLRQIKDDSRQDKLLMRALLAESSREVLIESYIRQLTGDSLQSADQLQKVKKALGLSIALDARVLKEVFRDRNYIIHELDIDFAAARRNRRIRKLQAYIDTANVLLELSEQFFDEIKKKLIANT